MLNPTYWQQLLRLPPAASDGRTVFVHDFHAAFTKVVFYGHELRLFVFEALLFLAIDSELRSVPTTAFIVYVVHSAIALTRASLGKNNLSRKTLVDKNFLI